MGAEDLSEPPHPEQTASRAAVTRPMETSPRMSGAYSGPVREDGGMLQVAPGLRRWTARHDHWEEDVGSLAVETNDGLVSIDPIDPPREVGRADHVLVTVYWHARSAGEIGAERVWASARSNRPLRTRGVEVTDPFHTGDDLPGGIRARGRCGRRAPRLRREAASDLRSAAPLPRTLAGEGNTHRAAQDPASAPRPAGRKRARLARRSDPQRRQACACRRFGLDGTTAA